MRAETVPRGRVVALDLGEARTGVAVSDPGRALARPLKVVPTGDLSGYLRGLVRREGVTEIVVGVPKTLGGDIGFQARRVLDTLGDLRQEFPGVTFVEWDERLTTRLAAAGVVDRARSRKKDPRGRFGRKTGGRVDDLAAARILQEYLRTKEHD